MRGLVPALLAGLAALTVLPMHAAAIFVENGELPEIRLDLEVRDTGCPDAAALCLVDLTGNLSSLNDGMRVDLHVVNHAADAAAAELFVTQRLYEGTADGNAPEGSDERVAPQMILHLDVAPGEAKNGTATVESGMGSARIQAVAAEHEAELDRVIPIRYTILGQGGGPADTGAVDEGQDPAPADQKDTSPSHDKQSGALPFLALVGALAAVLVAVRKLR